MRLAALSKQKMNDASEKNGSHLFNDFLEADSDENARRLLAKLHKDVIRPLVSSTLRKKLRVPLSVIDFSSANQDALDLQADVELSILDRLTKLRSNGGQDRIQNFDAYVRAGAKNSFNQLLRRRYPVRTSLSNQLRYILTRKPGLSIAKNSEDKWICGPDDLGDIDGVQTEPDLPEYETIAADLPSKMVNGRLSDLVTALINIYGRPVALERLIEDVFRLRGLQEPKMVEVEAARDSTTQYGSEQGSKLEQREFLERLWVEVRHLPLLHKRALLLNLSDAKGGSAIFEFPLLGIASIRRIAEAIEMDADEFAELWGSLPLSDNEIAKRYDLTRQQVINLRHSARSTLKRRMGI